MYPATASRLAAFWALVIIVPLLPALTSAQIFFGPPPPSQVQQVNMLKDRVSDKSLDVKPADESLFAQTEAPTRYDVVAEAGDRFGNQEAYSGFEANVAVLWELDPHFSLGAGFGYSHFDNKVRTMSKGDVTVFPLEAVALIHSRAEKGFAPILRLGFGEAFLNHALNPEVNEFFAPYGVSDTEILGDTSIAEVSDGVAVKGRPVDLMLSVGYEYLDPTLDVTLKSTSNGATVYSQNSSVNLSSVFIRLGLLF